ncbi:B-cell receptor-associated protein 31 [Trachymyrmex septentrionalis]|uniref:Endoplasmic reticulum transmembrane protein n=1 Tax=Trachymyrmex septentrionalis TaxID=34720 RepID=A0A195FXC2_9HYME|nr:PREDICTED: B-cell receptor-associated protein 31 [Trachymyrmex septentrionalis]XP_018342151.1 PREDICTED: B-cell receptor-associated protein 31 [Trachymyrmex septentrionalis]KYN44962.1 B-cell receptor-associated protein 31 [Trachymyrmex septentrionalis]
MSLQWTLIAGFLYIEVAIVLLLVLPVASPTRWQKFFKSRFLQSLNNQASIYFVVLLGVLVLFLLDAIREMRKYSTSLDHPEHHQLNVEMQENMRLFRAQRNFYISGFALFLSLVIRRLIILISAQASLLAQHEAAMRQAQSATTTARSLLSQRTIGESAQNDSNEAHDKAVSELKTQIKELQAKNQELESNLIKEKMDKEVILSQAESVTKEYDRLTRDYMKLTRSDGDKKTD